MHSPLSELAKRVPPLIAALNKKRTGRDTDWQTNQGTLGLSFAEALATLGGREAETALGEFHKLHPHETRTWREIQEFGRKLSEATIESPALLELYTGHDTDALNTALASDDAPVRRDTCVALGQLGAVGSISFLAGVAQTDEG